MNIDQIIKMGQEIAKPDLPWYSEFTLGLWAVILILFIVGGFLFFWGMEDFAIFRPLIGMGMVVLSTLMFIVLIVMSIGKEDEIYKKEITVWEDKYVKPYIELLSTTKKEIIYIKIETELSHSVEGKVWWRTGYTRSTEI